VALGGHGQVALSSGLGRKGSTMRRVVLVGVGFLLTLAGVVFTLQGVGILGGSVMSGITFWAVAGPVIALAGVAMAAIGLRDRPAG
jgi:predicted cobalt transporter CbtA